MERTSPIKSEEQPSPQESKKLRWKKIGGGTFRLGTGKIIKPNQVFTAFPDEIPHNFRDTIIPLDALPVEEREEEKFNPKSQPVTKYEIRTNESGGGWYDIMNTETGKQINEKALRRDDAERMLEGLK